MTLALRDIDRPRQSRTNRTKYVYDAAGRRIETRSSSSDLSAQLSYDARGRLFQITSTRADGSSAVTTTYPDYDEAGNRERMDTTQGQTAYLYDGLHRLTHVNAVGILNAFLYDAAGNRTKSGRKYSGVNSPINYPFRDYAYSQEAAHRLETFTLHINASSSVLESFPAYDANGNPTAWVHEGAARTLTWDALDRLVAIGGAFSASYAYDPLGRRLEKTEAGTTTRYQYDGLDVVAEYTGASVLTATYAYGPGIDEPLKAQRGATLAAYHTDGLGSVLLVSQADGASATLASYAYDAFGEDLGSSGGFENPYTFTGRERDASGLVYYRARYYLPRTGRFVSPDPLGLAGGANPYAYAGSNPVNFTDPLGLTPLYSKAGFGNATSPLYFPAFSALPSGVPQGGPFQSGAAILAGGIIGLAVATCGVCAVPAAFLSAAALKYDYSHDFEGLLGLPSAFLDTASGRATFGRAFGPALAVSGLVTGSASLATRATTPAVAARGASSPLVFRQGTFAHEAVGWSGNVVKGRQWAAENPLTTPNYAKRYGLPAENATPDWVVGGRIRGPYEVRPAPASHNNPLNTGGAPEYVPSNPNDVILEFFHMPN